MRAHTHLFCFGFWFHTGRDKALSRVFCATRQALAGDAAHAAALACNQAHVPQRLYGDLKLLTDPSILHFLFRNHRFISVCESVSLL